MRKRRTNILLAASAIFVLSVLPACSGQSGDSVSHRSYEHIDYVSAIEKEDCYLCGGRTDHEASAYWGQDNVDLVDVNTFDAVHIEINRYDDNGQLIEEATGSMRMGMCSIGEATASVMSDVDRGYAHIDITPSGNGINADAIGAYLCEDCLDDFAGNFFEHDNPPEVRWSTFPHGSCVRWRIAVPGLPSTTTLWPAPLRTPGRLICGSHTGPSVTRRRRKK